MTPKTYKLTPSVVTKASDDPWLMSDEMGYDPDDEVRSAASVTVQGETLRFNIDFDDQRQGATQEICDILNAGGFNPST